MPTDKHVPPTNEELEHLLRIHDDSPTVCELIAEVQRLRGVCEREADDLEAHAGKQIAPIRAVMWVVADRLRAAAEGR